MSGFPASTVRLPGRKMNSVAFLLFVMVSAVSALYEDQVGKFDWLKTFVGYPMFVETDYSNSRLRSQLIIATEQNVLASFDASNGQLLWRQAFESEDRGRIDRILITPDGVVASFSHGRTLRKFDRIYGELIWETLIVDHDCHSVTLSQFGNKIAVGLGSRVVLVSRHGVRLSEFRLFPEQALEISWVSSARTLSAAEMVVAACSAGDLIYVTVDADRGKVKHDRVSNASCESSKCYLLSTFTACVDGRSSQVNFYSSLPLSEHHVENVVDAITEVFQVDPHSLCLKGRDRVQCWAEKHGSLTKVVDENVQGADPFKAAYGCDKYFFLSFESTQKIGFSVLDGDRKSVKRFTKSYDYVAAPDKVYAIQTRFGIQPKCDILILSKDGTLHLIDTSGSKHWRRYEALSTVLSYAMFDLPLSESQANIEKEFSAENGMLLKMFMRRISSHLQQLKSAFYRSMNELLNVVGLFGIDEWLLLHHADGRKKPLERDQFSLHKMIVVATEFGNLFGIDSQDGAVVWHVHLQHLAPILINDKRALPMFVQRSTSHYRYSAQCAVFGENSLTGSKVLIVFDPITGSQIDRITFDVSISVATLLPFESFDGIRGILFLTDQNDAYVYPKSLDIPVFPDLRSKPTVVVKSSSKSAIITGYLMKNRLADDESASGKGTGNLTRWQMEVAWKSALSSAMKHGGSHHIVDMRLKRLDSRIHSQGRVLGDRSVLYKYLNPNLLVALVQSTAQRGEITFFLLDGVSGEILFAAAKSRLSPPYHLLLCENWILFSYWNERSRRTEVTVLELYEGYEQQDPNQFSSQRKLSPIVYQQTYIFPQGLSAIAVTETEKAITPRHLLLAMPFGGILEMPKAFLDPRRVLFPTMEQREEGLFPYVPDLPVASEHIVNYNQTVLNVRNMQTFPSGLESTSLLFVAGLDLFFSRVSPSGTFDILKEDFDHWFISVVLLSLLLASLLSKRLAKQRDLKQSWR